LDEAIKFLYPDGFATEDFVKRATLAPTNIQCDEWNSRIQFLNPNQPIELLASNELDNVDDPNGILHSMLNPDSLEFYNKPGVPLNQLVLKIGDTCFLLRTVSN
jgi:hypothetical protein